MLLILQHHVLIASETEDWYLDFGTLEHKKLKYLVIAGNKTIAYNPLIILFLFSAYYCGLLIGFG
jgi:hypothetical protein